MFIFDLKYLYRIITSSGFLCNYLFDQINTSGQVHSEINELPNDTFLLVDFLFQHKHVMVEELLQTFIGVVNAQLFEGVVLRRY